MMPSKLKAPSKLASLQKELVARVGSFVYPIYLVNEYPKSGGTWLKHMIAASCDVPVWSKGEVKWGSCVIQGHWNKPRGACRTVALFRDGRDVMVSFYYHCFFLNEFQNRPLVEIMRKRFKFSDYEDIGHNLLPFMVGMQESPISPSFNWASFVRKWWHRTDVVTTRYEDLRQNTAQELQRVMTELTGKQFELCFLESVVNELTMEKMRERKSELNPKVLGRQRAEKSFIRKGKVRGWEEVMSREAVEWFNDANGEELRLIGYDA